MKKNVVFSLVVILACLTVLISCRSMQNGGGPDWATVSMSVDLPSSSQSRKLAATSSSSAITSVIYAVPASVESVASDADLSEAYDQQIMDEISETVTLKVPLNESLRLAAKVVYDDLTLEQALAVEADMYGLSDAFTVDSDTTSKTVTINSANTLTGGWRFVDGDGATGINRDPTAGDGGDQRLHSYDCGEAACASENGLYAIWSEKSADTNQYNIRVAKWGGDNSWSFIDANGGSGANGINYNTGDEGTYPFMLTFSNRLYAIWSEEETSSYNNTQVHVAKYKNSLWPLVDSDSSKGINHDPDKYIKNPKATVFNNKLYVTWSEKHASTDISQIRLKQYDSDSDTWTAVDGDADDGLNKNPSYNAYEPHLEVVYNDLCITWHEENASGVPQVRVAKWDGSQGLLFVDGDGANGINKDTDHSAQMPELIYVEGSGVYATWGEVNAGSITQLRVAKWDEDDGWDFIDGNGADGLNHDTSHWAYLPRIVEFNSNVYITWMESADADPDTGISQIRVIEYNGSDWKFVDGNGTSGLNRDSSKSAQAPALEVHNSKLYATWMEMGDNGNYQVRVAEAETK